jgi:hypothetical protein
LKRIREWACRKSKQQHTHLTEITHRQLKGGLNNLEFTTKEDKLPLGMKTKNIKKLTIRFGSITVVNKHKKWNEIMYINELAVIKNEHLISIFYTYGQR